MKKVCVFTGSRADYGLLKPLIKKIIDNKNLKLQLIVSGTHLSKSFGYTIDEINNDYFPIDETVEILLDSDTPAGILKSMGIGLINFTESINRLKPDISIILGDRFEALSFAICCYINQIPICHIHGGEITSGSFDDGIRHSITKFSYLHFTSTEQYRKRVIQLGEDPSRVFNVGALAVDNILNTEFYKQSELEQKLGVKFKKYNFLITFHPSTLKYKNAEVEFVQLLEALSSIDNSLLIFTKANADPSGRRINELIDNFVLRNKGNAVVFASLGEKLYLSTMKYVTAIIGNSSSGIIEAPILKIPTINIGDRQSGRIKPDNVIDCQPYKDDILSAINKAMSDSFQESLKNLKNPYGDGHAAEKIVKIIDDFQIGNIEKTFYDIKGFDL